MEKTLSQHPKDYTKRREMLRAQAEALMAGQKTPIESIKAPADPFSQYHQTRFAQSLATAQVRLEGVRQEARAKAYGLLERRQALEGFLALQPFLGSLEMAQAEQEALNYAQALLRHLGGVYTPQQREAAPKIIWLALEVARREPQRLGGWRQSYVTFHLRGYELAAALFPGLGSSAAEKALERTLNALTLAGILERKSHIGNARDRATGRRLGWSDGTLLKLRINPDPRCRPPRLTVEELREEYCDLEFETQKHWTLRRSAKARALRKQVDIHLAMSETGSPEKEKRILKAIHLTTVNAITFSPRFLVSDDLGWWLARGMEQYESSPRVLQAAWVAEGTRKICAALNDGHSLKYWAAILWRGLSGDKGLVAALARALAEFRVVGLGARVRNPGAWVVGWLRRNTGVDGRASR